MEWNFRDAHLMTRWASNIDRNSPLPEYPRPHMERKEWYSLNGLWEYAITSKKLSSCEHWEGQILVPYPLESALSGVMKALKPTEYLWYRRHFQPLDRWKINETMRFLLHFGAVDWECTIFVNGGKVGSHKGGYIPFYFDITDFLKQHEENELLVRVNDPTDKGRQEHGKQILKPWGVNYTAVSGIWQTVWLEYVPSTRIERCHFVSDINTNTLRGYLTCVNLRGNETVSVSLKDPEEKNFEFKFENLGDICLEIPAAKLWSPDHPNIYRCEIRLFNTNQEIDKIDTYAIFRKIGLEKDNDGITRIFLNNRPLFQYGPLDQGYWPDGLYTPPTDEAMKFDIEIAKDLGFNMIRKHIKVEPARWYYYCDLLGILVWQDMPNGGSQLAGVLSQFVFHSKLSLTFGRKNSEVQNQYYKELTELVEHLKFFACIVMWVPFNEGWGQFNTERAVDLVAELDSTRLINNASGWVDFKVGHVHDIHIYPGPGMPALEKNRAAVNGEFGGLGYVVPDHNWKTKLKWAYRKYKNMQELSDNYEKLMLRLQKLIKQGLSAAVYTQITDVEGEVNGLLTYDREIFKIEPKNLRKWHSSLYSQINF